MTKSVLVSKKIAPLGGVEPPTFRLTAERASHCATEAYNFGIVNSIKLAC